jgi:hypothetical protein
VVNDVGERHAPAAPRAAMIGDDYGPGNYTPTRRPETSTRAPSISTASRSTTPVRRSPSGFRLPGRRPTFGSTKRRAAGGCLRVANPAPCPPGHPRPTRDELFGYHPWSRLLIRQGFGNNRFVDAHSVSRRSGGQRQRGQRTLHHLSAWAEAALGGRRPLMGFGPSLRAGRLAQNRQTLASAAGDYSFRCAVAGKLLLTPLKETPAQRCPR